MKVLVTGVNGQLGFDVMQVLTARGHEAIGVDVAEMDITKEDVVMDVITSNHVDAAIHCAAYTAVDAAEENIELCRIDYADGTRFIATAFRTVDIKLLF